MQNLILVELTPRYRFSHHMIPCNKYCLTKAFQRRYRVVNEIEEIKEKDKPLYYWCKWCERYLMLPQLQSKQWAACPCCLKRLHLVYKKDIRATNKNQLKPRYYEF